MLLLGVCSIAALMVVHSIIETPPFYIYFSALIIIRLPIGEIRKNVVCVGGGI